MAGRTDCRLMRWIHTFPNTKEEEGGKKHEPDRHVCTGLTENRYPYATHCGQLNDVELVGSSLGPFLSLGSKTSCACSALWNVWEGGQLTLWYIRLRCRCCCCFVHLTLYTCPAHVFPLLLSWQPVRSGGFVNYAVYVFALLGFFFTIICSDWEDTNLFIEKFSSILKHVKSRSVLPQIASIA